MLLTQIEIVFDSELFTQKYNPISSYILHATFFKTCRKFRLTMAQQFINPVNKLTPNNFFLTTKQPNGVLHSGFKSRCWTASTYNRQPALNNLRFDDSLSHTLCINLEKKRLLRLTTQHKSSALKHRRQKLTFLHRVGKVINTDQEEGKKRRRGCQLKTNVRYLTG